MNNITIGISCGDINGIGLEVILKAIAIKKIGANYKLIIYGSTKVVAYHKNIITQENIQFHSIMSAEEAQSDRINVINCWNDSVNITLGKATDMGGKCAYDALERAVKDLKTGEIDALVTAPIHKKAMQLANFPFIGHTEYITTEFKAKDSLMFMVSDNLRVGLVTNHLPIREVPAAITRCGEAGIAIRMVTGDHPATALTIARQLGLSVADTEVVTGTQMTELGDRPDALNTLILGGRVFARIEPTQKLEIVQH
ncbi:MAG: 4-hydroxythreonine-4-phosphate dehydrogenase PdxA, partial [Saprospiraceae bacterium]|nr:4-hydroxythreonine-4-phosphate dehydrogenase PdxA [Saprospiraceae bacterium]